MLATAVGPEVPEEGRFPVPATTPCTFTVTLTYAAGAVVLTGAAFSIVDEHGRLHHPRVTAQHPEAVPARMRAGQTVAGQTVVLRYTPFSRRETGSCAGLPPGTPIVSWDFGIEIDEPQSAECSKGGADVIGRR